MSDRKDLLQNLRVHKESVLQRQKEILSQLDKYYNEYVADITRKQKEIKQQIELLFYAEIADIDRRSGTTQPKLSPKQEAIKTDGEHTTIGAEQTIGKNEDINTNGGSTATPDKKGKSIKMEVYSLPKRSGHPVPNRRDDGVPVLGDRFPTSTVSASNSHRTQRTRTDGHDSAMDTSTHSRLIPRQPQQHNATAPAPALPPINSSVPPLPPISSLVAPPNRSINTNISAPNGPPINMNLTPNGNISQSQDLGSILSALIPQLNDNGLNVNAIAMVNVPNVPNLPNIPFQTNVDNTGSGHDSNGAQSPRRNLSLAPSTSTNSTGTFPSPVSANSSIISVPPLVDSIPIVSPTANGSRSAVSGSLITIKQEGPPQSRQMHSNRNVLPLPNLHHIPTLPPIQTLLNASNPILHSKRSNHSNPMNSSNPLNALNTTKPSKPNRTSFRDHEGDGEQKESHHDLNDMYRMEIDIEDHLADEQKAVVEYQVVNEALSLDEIPLMQRALIPEEHLTVSKTSDRRKWKCDYCRKWIEYRSDRETMMHLQQHLQERKFKCAYCPKIFKRKSDVIRHSRTHTGERPHKCDTCGKGFGTKYCLKTHLRTHTGEMPYSCSMCGKKFRQNSHLTVHWRTHTGDKPYECKICGKRFSQHSTLAVHNRIHNGQKPFVCPCCKREFTQRHSLQRHLRNVHRDYYDKNGDQNIDNRFNIQKQRVRQIQNQQARADQMRLMEVIQSSHSSACAPAK